MARTFCLTPQMETVYMLTSTASSIEYVDIKYWRLTFQCKTLGYFPNYI